MEQAHALPAAYCPPESSARVHDTTTPLFNDKFLSCIGDQAEPPRAFLGGRSQPRIIDSLDKWTNTLVAEWARTQKSYCEAMMKIFANSTSQQFRRNVAARGGRGWCPSRDTTHPLDHQKILLVPIVQESKNSIGNPCMTITLPPLQQFWAEFHPSPSSFLFDFESFHVSVFHESRLRLRAVRNHPSWSSSSACRSY
jgi:hypothetical protein